MSDTRLTLAKFTSGITVISQMVWTPLIKDGALPQGDTDGKGWSWDLPGIYNEIPGQGVAGHACDPGPREAEVGGP